MIVNLPVETTDDLRYGILPDIPVAGTIFNTLPQFCDHDELCEIELPRVGKISLPGLNSSMFNTTTINGWSSAKRPLGVQLVRLPRMHSLANQALKAKTGPKAAEYDYYQSGAGIRAECTQLISYLLIKNALRTRSGLGWMALSQANPSLPEDIIMVSEALAAEVLPILHEKKPLLFRSVQDLNGLKMSVVIRFPATTSKSVRTDMKLVVGGPGRCCYLNPFVLKYGFVGDVDGDLFFMAINELLEKDISVYKKMLYDPTINFEVPRIVTPSNFKGDITLFDLGNPPAPKDWETYQGQAGKDGIGEITNACYRAAAIARICFQETPAMRRYFLNKAERPDLEAMLPMVGTEKQQRQIFRCLATLIVMDEFTPWYELTFDLRKEICAAPYLEHLLSCLRRPDLHVINFAKLREVKLDGKHVTLKALPIIWKACEGRLAAFLNNYPVIQLQFGGRGNTETKKAQVDMILDLVKDDPAEFFERELRGITHTKLVPA